MSETPDDEFDNAVNDQYVTFRRSNGSLEVFLVTSDLAPEDIDRRLAKAKWELAQARRELAKAALPKLTVWWFQTPRPGAVARSVTPPSIGLFMVSLVAPMDRQDEMLGDLEERFRIQMGRFGPRGAMFWYWWSVIRLFATCSCRGVIGLLGLADLVDRFKSQ